VTIVALGGLLLPMLLREKYPERFSLGLLTAGGSLGLLFPPSLPVIVYGMVAGTDVDKLFKAGALPGLLLVFAISAYAAAVGYFREVPRHAFSLRRLGRTALYAAPELLIPVIIVGGIYSGAMAAVQAAAVTAFYVLIVEVALYRDVGIYDLPGIMRKSAELVGAIVVILGMAMGLGNYFVDAEVPQKLLEAVRSRITSPLSFLFVLNGFLLVVGCLLDIFSATLLVVPLITPLAAQYHINPFHLGIVFLTNLEIGYLTPPVGMNLFLASLRFRRPALEIAWNALPFLLILLGCLAIITYVPWLSSS
jgi:tripartite ATP-independent transporter DctM subunit